VLYLAIPAHNEVATIGVLLWRIRTVLAEFPREYEVVVYDDASSDDTAEVAEQYAHAMPVTVLRGATHVGYAGALDALIRHVAAQTRYPRRDAFLLVQGDFTDPPGIVPEFARRFEGGADLVVGERMVVATPLQGGALGHAAVRSGRRRAGSHRVHASDPDLRAARVGASGRGSPGVRW
jgi:glycosyltransferase involved in cell wall biosynthesis